MNLDTGLQKPAEFYGLTLRCDENMKKYDVWWPNTKRTVL